MISPIPLSGRRHARTQPAARGACASGARDGGGDMRACARVLQMVDVMEIMEEHEAERRRMAERAAKEQAARQTREKAVREAATPFHGPNVLCF